MTSTRSAEKVLSRLALVALVLFVTGVSAWLVPATTVSLELQGKDDYQIFFDDGAGFNEADSRQIRINNSAPKIIELHGLPARTSSLRIDPGPGPGRVTVCAVSRQLEPLPGFIAARDNASRITAAHETQPAQASQRGCQSWVVTSNATDPQILVDFDPESYLADIAQSLKWLVLFLLTLATGLLLLVMFALPTKTRVRLKGHATLVYDWLDKKLVIIFLVLAGVLGTGYAFLTPPGSVPDEMSHAGKVARISIGDWVGADDPGPFPAMADGYGPFTGFLHTPRKFSMAELNDVATRQLRCARSSASNHDAAAAAAPVPYLVPTMMYQITCAQGGSFGAFLYGSRLLNLAIYIALVAFGIRVAGFGRWALFSVALLPMSLYLAASISYDSSMLAGTFCLLGLVSGVYSARLSCRSALVPILLVSLFLVFQKPQAGWVFVLPMIAFVRCNEQEYSPLKWFLLTTLVPVSMHLAWVVTSISMAVDRPDVMAVNGMDSLFQQPWRFADVLFATYTSSSVGLFVVKGVVGVLGWLDVYLTSGGYWSGGAALLLASLIRGRGEGLKWRAWIFYIVAALGAFVVSNLPFYMFWTEPASEVIQGLQGRYFLTMAAVILMSNPVSVRSWGRLTLAIACIVLLMASSMSALLALQSRYFE